MDDQIWDAMTLAVLQDLPCLEPVAPLDISSSSFRCVSVLEHVSLLPCYVGRLSDGVIEYLNEKVFHFSDQLGGIILSYSKPQVLQQHGIILDEHPHIHFNLKYSVHLFKPELGSIMCGSINNVGQDHLGCLVHNCFNAAVLGPSSTEQMSAWYSQPFHIGAPVWFTVTNLENVGGIVSISGEYYDLHAITADKAKSSHPKTAKRKQDDSDLEMASSSDQGNRKRRRHHTQTVDSGPKAKRTKLICEDVGTVKHKKKSKQKSSHAH